MGFSSIWHWVVVLLIVLLLFGAGKLPKVMGDLAKGIKNFKAGLKDEDEDATAASNAPASGQVLPNQPVPPAAQPTAAQPTAAQPAAAQPAAQDPGVKKDETART